MFHIDFPAVHLCDMIEMMKVVDLSISHWFSSSSLMWYDWDDESSWFNF